MIWGLVRRILFGFDAERVHRLSIFAIEIFARIWVRPFVRFSPAPRGQGARIEVGAAQPAQSPQSPATARIGPLTFANPVGLAAGFDKDAEIVEALPTFGFGFAEIGTVTPLPQAGNPKPRLFRNAKDSVVFNRMGFNGAGAIVVAERLARGRKYLPAEFRVGVNVGKNKNTPNELAHQDFAKAAQPFAGLADYIVINVSSPNTPGLRALQNWELLAPILGAVQDVCGRWKAPQPPILLKLAPELAGETLQAIIEGAERAGASGFVLTNTLAGKWPTREGELAGGLSGKPVAEHARTSLIQVRSLTKLPLVSVGGILTVQEAIERRKLGADLIQIYSGWVFNGPTYPSQLARALAYT